MTGPIPAADESPLTGSAATPQILVQRIQLGAGVVALQPTVCRTSQHEAPEDHVKMAA